MDDKIFMVLRKLEAQNLATATALEVVLENWGAPVDSVLNRLNAVSIRHPNIDSAEVARVISVFRAAAGRAKAKRG